MSAAEGDAVDWDAVSFIISSRYRAETMRALLKQPATPTQIGDDVGLSTAHTSRALAELSDENLVELLVDEDRKKGRIYGLTDVGQAAAETVEERASA